ncbi:MAG: 30S ribosomal protein S5 [Limisphaerales bacterium]
MVAENENSQQAGQQPAAAPEVNAPAGQAAPAPQGGGQQGGGYQGGGGGGGFGGGGGGQRGGFGGRGGQRGGGPGRGGPRRPRDDQFQKDQGDLSEKVIFINRSSKVVKGGRRFSFSALVVVGDKKGRVGLGLGKAGEVADAIRKGNDDAKHSMLSVSLKDATIPHEVLSEYGGARILLRPASPGTGIIAGKTVRAVVESAGVKDILTKSLGSKNAANVAKATLKALQHLRLRESIMKGRGIEIRRRPAHVTAEQTTA